MKAKVTVVGLVLLMGLAAGVTIGMNIAREAPILSNPFTDQETRTKLSERIGQQAKDVVVATKKNAQQALDDTKRKLHEATESQEQ